MAGGTERTVPSGLATPTTGWTWPSQPGSTREGAVVTTNSQVGGHWPSQVVRWQSRAEGTLAANARDADIHPPVLIRRLHSPARSPPSRSIFLDALQASVGANDEMLARSPLGKVVFA